MILIIGYGNPLRGDDGVGPHIAQQLSECVTRRDVEVLARHQLTIELAEPISRAEQVIFVDAAVNAEPGAIVVNCISAPDAPPVTGTHQLDPSLLLAYAREWYGNAPSALLIAIGGAVFDYSELLSSPVQAAVPRVLRLIEGFLRNSYTAYK
jgi:hydrogenase maturation protease